MSSSTPTDDWAATHHLQGDSDEFTVLSDRWLSPEESLECRAAAQLLKGSDSEAS